MADCNKCVVYNEEYDTLRMTFNDVLIVGKSNDNHFCAVYDNGMPEGVFNGKKDCPYYTERGETNVLQS